MEVIYPRCAGLDVHKEVVVASARVVSEGALQQEVRTFGTTTRELGALADWLKERGVTHVAMEATGVYWKPVWHVLEESFTLVLANAGHIKNVPGRKTDVNDATWIADLLAHGLIRASFVPPRPVQEMRTLTRTRKQLVRERAMHVLRIHKVLEDANIKITSVISDIVGKTGRAMLKAIIAGETDPGTLAALANHRVKAKRAEIVEALRGRITPHHRFMLRLHLDQIDATEKSIARVEEELDAVLAPFRAKADLLKTIPGVSDTVAEVVVAEVGIDMSRFPTVGHLISWAGLCPRSDESAGKRRSTRLRKATPWLKTTLVQAAWAAARSKGTYLNAQFLRLKARRGPKKAVVAVAASILTAAYYMLRNDQPYADLGSSHFDDLNKTRITARLVRRLADLGYQVDLKPAA
jgi:transposase